MSQTQLTDAERIEMLNRHVEQETERADVWATSCRKWRDFASRTVRRPECPVEVSKDYLDTMATDT